VCLSHRYRNGIRGFTKASVQELLRHYLRVEQLFQSSSYDKSIDQLRRQEADMNDIVATIFSHSQVIGKNQLVIRIIVSYDLK